MTWNDIKQANKELGRLKRAWDAAKRYNYTAEASKLKRQHNDLRVQIQNARAALSA